LASPGDQPQPVIIDTDPGVDDALALLLAAACPELAVQAVTTVAGNAPLARVTDNARRVLALAWADAPPPLHRGEAGGVRSAARAHGGDGLGGAARASCPAGRPLYPAATPLAGGPAPAAILSLASARPGEITLIALGPMTNLAAAYRLDPLRFRQLRRIVAMGGAFRVPGNVTPVAEFNVFIDPEAARLVCGAGVPVTWVPLDVTHQCLLRPAAVRQLPDTPSGRFIAHSTSVMMHFQERYCGEAGCYLHDPLAIGAAAWPELLETVGAPVDVETDGRLTRGMTVADFRPLPARAGPAGTSRIALQVDAPEFTRRFLERLGIPAAA
jgi:inosine-uridine nucleoside N-ribohydrolase